jgi:thiamine pyrophosphokinase
MKENDYITSVLIVGSGEDFKPEKIKKLAQEAQLIIAGDGGANALSEIGFFPDILIGDMDSISKDVLEKMPETCEIFRYPQAKDYSDSELCIKKALEYQPQKITLAAVTGTYIDHTLTNLLSLFTMTDGNTKIEIVTSNSTIFLITPQMPAKMNGMNGRRFSFFPFESITGLIMEGFYYHFSGNSLRQWEYSLSNVINNDTALLAFETGKGMGILFDENYS